MHTLGTLMGAIADAPMQQWATFYDIRRYGGLQIFLRALIGRGSLTVGTEGENISPTLARFGDAGITHVSGTPTHWRKVLMSGEGHRIDPEYVRLSGEIADEPFCRPCTRCYPRARSSTPMPRQKPESSLPSAMANQGSRRAGLRTVAMFRLKL